MQIPCIDHFLKRLPMKEKKKTVTRGEKWEQGKFLLFCINETWAWLWPWRRIQLKRKDWRSNWVVWAVLTLLSCNLLYWVSIFSWQIGIFLSKFGSASIFYPLHFQCHETSLRVPLMWIFYCLCHFLWNIFILFVTTVFLIYVHNFTFTKFF